MSPLTDNESGTFQTLNPKACTYEANAFALILNQLVSNPFWLHLDSSRPMLPAAPELPLCLQSRAANIQHLARLVCD